MLKLPELLLILNNILSKLLLLNSLILLPKENEVIFKKKLILNLNFVIGTITISHLIDGLFE